MTDTLQQIPKENVQSSNILVTLDQVLQEKSTYKRRILTGMRPSGPLHVGHYFGALDNWLKLQDHFDCMFLIADLHALADHSEHPEVIRQNVIEVTLDWLAAGLDPQKGAFFVQTGVSELENLTVLFETMVSLKRHQLNPTLKSELERMNDSQKTVSFHNYPISQAADILGPLGDLVPAGADQQPMIELARDIAARYNKQYAGDFVFPQPQILLGSVPRLVGTDGGEKMSKTIGNTINLSDSTEIIRKKVNEMISPVKKLQESGRVEGHVVFMYLDIFHKDKQELEEVKRSYEKGGIGEKMLKDMLFQDVEEFIAPIRERRAQLAKDLSYVQDILVDGTSRVKARVQGTLMEVRFRMGTFMG